MVSVSHPILSKEIVMYNAQQIASIKNLIQARVSLYANGRSITLHSSALADNVLCTADAMGLPMVKVERTFKGNADYYRDDKVTVAVMPGFFWRYVDSSTKCGSVHDALTISELPKWVQDIVNSHKEGGI